MKAFRGFGIVVTTVAVAAALSAQTTVTGDGAERAALARFDAAVGDYLKAHRFHDPVDLETLCLPDGTTPAAALLDQPPSPQEGGVLAPDVTAVIRARIAALDLPKPRGQARRIEVAVGEPVAAGRTARVPKAVLAVLPPVPADLDYRLAGADLLLLDLRTNIVIDALRGWRTA